MMYDMSNTASGSPPEDRERGSWASENLPVSLRRELLERELTKLGFRKAGEASANAGAGQQHAGGSSHPQADGDGDGHGE